MYVTFPAFVKQFPLACVFASQPSIKSAGRQVAYSPLPEELAAAAAGRGLVLVYTLLAISWLPYPLKFAHHLHSCTHWMKRTPHLSPAASPFNMGMPLWQQLQWRRRHRRQKQLADVRSCWQSLPPLMSDRRHSWHPRIDTTPAPLSRSAYQSTKYLANFWHCTCRDHNAWTLSKRPTQTAFSPRTFLTVDSRVFKPPR